MRDAIVSVLRTNPGGARLATIEASVTAQLGKTAASSIRSYLRLNTPRLFVRAARGFYVLREGVSHPYAPSASPATAREPFRFREVTLYHADCFEWLGRQPPNTFHAVVTDPPYGLVEYLPEQQEKLRNGKGGIWRIPPSFDGVKRSPLPRFTVLTEKDLAALEQFFASWARVLVPTLVPGANVLVASNPLLSHVVSGALARMGLERRGELVRLVMTMRGGDRPKAAHEEFSEVSVMPRAMWEPWLVFRKPLEGRAQDNLRKWGTGGFRRPSKERPFGDVIRSSPTTKAERALAPHPSLKPQAFLRQIVRASLPLGKGIILDPFAGSGSTLAAAEALGYTGIGVEKDPHYWAMARKAIPKLAEYRASINYSLSV